MRIKFITVVTIGLCVGYVIKGVSSISEDVAKGINEGVNPSLASKSYLSKVTNYRRVQKQRDISKAIASLTNLQ